MRNAGYQTGIGKKLMHASAFLKTFIRNDRGTTAIEYGLIAALVCIGIISALNAVADENTGIWAIVTRNVTAVL